MVLKLSFRMDVCITPCDLLTFKSQGQMQPTVSLNVTGNIPKKEDVINDGTM